MGAIATLLELTSGPGGFHLSSPNLTLLRSAAFPSGHILIGTTLGTLSLCSMYVLCQMTKTMSEKIT